MSVKKGLGRGFESLIPTDFLDETFDPTAQQDNQVSELRHLRVGDIKPDPEQPRRHFDPDAIDELARSIAAHGVLQPIVVTPYKGTFQIVAGERRYRAAVLAGLEKIPALVRTLTGQHKLELSLIENIQRRDLNPLETATSYAKLRDQFNLSLEEIGQRVGGRSVSAISNTLRLLKLPAEAQRAIVEGKLSEGQARPLVNMPTVEVEALLPRIIEEGWSVRRIEQYVIDGKKKAEAQKDKPTEETLPYQEMGQRLASRLGTPVSVASNAKGAGRITIRFTDERELRRIQSLLEK